MVAISQTFEHNTLRRIRQIQTVTILWMSIEAGISLFAAWKARSPALLAFGGDGAVELLSATVVFWRFRAGLVQPYAERTASRIAGILLFALVVYVGAVSVLSLMEHNEPTISYLGIAILIVAAAFMPWLAIEKRKLSAASGSAALRADAAQSGLCAYLSLIALIGLVVNAVWHFGWADPIAALAIIPLLLWEGKEAISGRACGCH
jgi:divalent metal cation (Fe/Co/Zn/Cd) transporter